MATNVAQTPVNVSKLGYISVETPDVERMVDYYTNALNFALVEKSDDTAYLTTTFDHHSVTITKADTPRVRGTVGYEISEDLSDAERRLREAGFQVDRRSDIAPSTPDVLILEEPTTGVEVHLYDRQSLSDVDEFTLLSPTKLGHVAGFVKDLKPLQDFYQGLLGFRWSDTIGDFFVFLRCNSDHHAANFMASSKHSGLHHVAYEMRDLIHLQSLLDHLAQRDVRLHWGPGRHGAGHNVFTYHKDPDGNNVELFTQLDVMTDENNGYFEPRPWHEDSPQYPKTWEVDLAAVNSWGPINYDMLDH